MIRIVLWTGFLAALALLWGRELLAYGAARRLGEDTRDDLMRFRRRTLGLVLLLLLGAMADGGSFVEPYLDPRGRLGYYGVCFIVLIWLLIVATRDFRALSASWTRDRDLATLDFLARLEREFDGGDEDRRPIPKLDFPDRDGEGNPRP